MKTFLLKWGNSKKYLRWYISIILYYLYIQNTEAIISILCILKGKQIYKLHNSSCESKAVGSKIKWRKWRKSKRNIYLCIYWNVIACFCWYGVYQRGCRMLMFIGYKENRYLQELRYFLSRDFLISILIVHLKSQLQPTAFQAVT